jgi:hypothetical protein
MLAEKAIKIKTVSQYMIPPQDERNVIKRQVMKEWQNIWEQTKLSKPIKHYKEFKFNHMRTQTLSTININSPKQLSGP